MINEILIYKKITINKIAFNNKFRIAYNKEQEKNRQVPFPGPIRKQNIARLTNSRISGQ